MVVKTDLCASNGVIHGIDSVLGVEGVGNGDATSSEMDLESSRDKSSFAGQDWYQIIFENKPSIPTMKLKKIGKYNKKLNQKSGLNNLD